MVFMQRSHNAYWGKNKPYCKKDCEKIVRPDESELTIRRLNAFEAAKANESRRGFKELLQCVFFVVFSMLAFGAHWIIAKKCRNY